MILRGFLKEGAYRILFVCFCSFCLGAMYGLSKPSLQPFLVAPRDADPPGLGESQTIYAWAVAFLSVGEFLGGFVLGFLIDKTGGIKAVSFLACVLGITGSLVYVFAANGWMLMISRCLTGMWSAGMLSSMRSYLTKFAEKDHLKIFFTLMQIVSTLASFCGAGVVGLFDGVNIGGDILRLDSYRAPGWLLATLTLILVCYLIVFYRQDPREEQVLEPLDPEEEQVSLEDSSLENVHQDNSFLPAGLNVLTLCALLGMVFSFSWGFGVLETVTTPMTRDIFGMSVSRTSTVFLSGSSSSLTIFILLFMAELLSSEKYSKEITSYRMCVAAILLSVIGTIIWTDWPAMIFTDECQNYTCSFDLNRSFPCPPDKTYDSCVSHPGCIWMQNATFGDCPACPKVCRDPGKSLHLAQLYSGFILVNLGCSLGKIGIGSLFLEYLAGGYHGFLMGINVSVGSLARILAPVVAIWIYDNSSHTGKLLMPMLFLLFLVTSVFFLAVGACEKPKYSSL